MCLKLWEQCINLTLRPSFRKILEIFLSICLEIKGIYRYRQSVTITNDGISSFEFYQKPAKKPLFVHRKSAFPMSNKRNIIQSERNRILFRSFIHVMVNHVSQHLELSFTLTIHSLMLYSTIQSYLNVVTGQSHGSIPSSRSPVSHANGIYPVIIYTSVA